MAHSLSRDTRVMLLLGTAPTLAALRLGIQPRKEAVAVHWCKDDASPLSTRLASIL